MAILKDLIVQSGARIIGPVYGNSFVKAGGTASQFLKADGSVDSNVYITSASLPSFAALGSATKPVYLSGTNTFSACSTYAGGTAVTLNGTSKAASTASFYAPEAAGTSGQFLKSNGSGAPSWSALPAASTSVAGITTVGASGGAAAYDHNHNGTYKTVQTAVADAPVVALSGTTLTFKRIDQNTNGVISTENSSTTLTFGSSPSSSNYIATKAELDAILAANDAMVFKGTIGSSGATVTALPTSGYSSGWTYKVITAGTYAGQNCEIGDMIICVKDYNSSSAGNADWTVIQSNIDGAVTGPASSTANHIAIFSGTTGKVIADSGFTIGTSVPANALFTDTDTKVTSAANHYTPSTDSGSALTKSASGATAAWSIDVVTGLTISRDTKGHVTGLSVTSGKVPANPNTDTKVKQTASTGNASYPLLASAQSSPTSATAYEAIYNTGVTVNYSTKKITASGFVVTNGTSAGFLKADGSIDTSTYALSSAIPTVPTNVSAFTNDAGYLTSHQSIKSIISSTSAQTAPTSATAIAGTGNLTLHKVAWTGTYSDLIGTPTIPAAANNATLTLKGQYSGTSGSIADSSGNSLFTANASSGSTLTITGSAGIKTYRSTNTVTIQHTNAVTAVTSAGFYKVKYDAQGHITGTTAVAKADITGLGIPGSNDTYTFSTDAEDGKFTDTASGSVHTIKLIEIDGGTF